MHVNVQLCFNPAVGKEAPCYRLKESYRDIRGTVHSLIVLNIGFEPSLLPLQIKRIARVLTDRFNHRNSPSLFPSALAGLPEEERMYVWRSIGNVCLRKVALTVLTKSNGLQTGKRKIHHLDTVEHTDARNVGAGYRRNMYAGWLCEKTIDSLGLEAFFQRLGWSETSMHAALSNLMVRTVYALPDGLPTVS